MMKNTMIKAIMITSVLFLSACKSGNNKSEAESAEANIEEVKLVTPIAETVFSSASVRPGNLALTTDGRLFVSMTPLVGPKTKVFELNTNGKDSSVGYPNAKYATGDDSVFKAVIGTRADSKGNLWLLDMGTKKFTVWNTNTNTLVKTIDIPANVVVSTSFLQDFIIDEINNRVIIADMTQGDLKSPPIPAFIVIDTETGKARRMAQSHPSMMPEIEGGFALNPIAIDPNFEYVYFGALHGRTIYRVPAKSFDSEESLKNDIKKFGRKSFCDGMAVDGDENVYITNVEKSELGVFNKKDGFQTLATLPEGQSWPDGLYVASDGYLYGTVDQLNRTAALNKGKDESTGPYLVVRTKLLSSKNTYKVGFLVTVKAKKGKEKEVENFVASAVELAKKEPNTLQWYAFKLDESTYGVFDMFANELGRQDHLHGKIAAALFSKTAKQILEGVPSIQKTNILSYKNHEEKRTNKLGFLVTVKAKKGRENDVKNFVSSAVALANKEANTLKWYAFQLDESTYGVFDTFPNEEGRQEHLHGKIAEALFSAKAKEILEGEPSIQKTTVLSSKY